jgi:hypothetical protein
MKKLALLFSISVVLLPTIVMSATCVPYSENYALEANGAKGTLAKVQTITGNHYSITSTINASKFFVTKTIVQTATGTCDAQGEVIAKNFMVTKDDNSDNEKLATNQFDTLSLVLFLSNSLSSNLTSFPSTQLLYNGKPMTVQCEISNANSTLTLGDGKNISAIQVACATADNATVLSYAFSQDPAHKMLSANAVEEGRTTLSAIID